MENQNIYDLLGFVVRSKTRQEVLKVLLAGDKTSRQIAEETGIIQSRASVVLKQLRDNNLISGEGKRNIVYSKSSFFQIISMTTMQAWVRVFTSIFMK